MTLVKHHPFVYAHAPEPFVAIEIESHNIIDYNPPFSSEFCNPDVPLYSRSFSKNLIHPSQIEMFVKKFSEFFEKHAENIHYKRTIPISEVSYSNRHHISLDCLSLRDTQFPKYIKYDWFVFTESGDDTPDIAFLCGRPAGLHGSEEDRRMYVEFMDFFDNAPIALHWLSIEGIILWANKTEMAFLGYTREEFIGQPIIKFCVDEEYVGGLFKSLSCGETIQDCPIRLRAKDGKIKDILVDSNVNWNPDGSWNHTRCFLRDDTKRKVEEAKIKEQRDSAQRLVRDKDEFLQTVVHDLRTPMNGLLGLVQYISSVIDNLPPPQRDQFHETAGMIQQAGHELCVLLDNIIDATKFDEGVFAKPNLKKFNLADLIERHKERFIRVVESSKVPVYVALGFRDDSNVFSKDANGVGKDWEVYGDETMMRRVLENLLSNSLKFTSRGSIVIEVLCRRAKWFETDQPGDDGRLKRLVGLFQISIIDTGVGISKEHINRVFEKYWQLIPENPKEEENASSTQFKMGRGGNGIGLNICKKLINSMGGEIKVKSTPNIGTTIRCTIPMEIVINGKEEPVVCNWPMRFEVPFTVKENNTNPQSLTPLRYPSQPLIQTQALTPKSQQQPLPLLPPPQTQPQPQPQPKQQPQQQVQPQEQPQLKQQPQQQTQPQQHVQAQAQVQTQTQAQAQAQAQIQTQTNAEVLAKAQAQAQAQAQALSQAQALALQQKPPQPKSLPQVQPLKLQLKSDSQQPMQKIESPRNSGSPRNSLSPRNRPQIEPLLPAEQKPQDVYFSDTTTATTKKPTSTAASSSTSATPVSSMPLNILVVDDNLLCQKVATRFLSQLGATVDIATNGLEAIDAYNKSLQIKRYFDVILMDLRMPRMDGITAAQKLTVEIGCTIPIIAVTCEKSRDRLEDCFKTGNMTAVLNKPIMLKDLVDVLKKALPNKGIKT